MITVTYVKIRTVISKSDEFFMNNLKVLITKLSPHARISLEKSANTCIAQQNYEIEIEHFLLELLTQNYKNDLQIFQVKYVHVVIVS